MRTPRQPLSAKWIAVAAALMAGHGLAEPPADDPLVERVGPFFAAYCTDCHSGGEDAEAGVDLEVGVSLAKAQANRARWNQIRGLIELRAMPPSDHYVQPTEEERQAAAEAIDELLNQVDCGVAPDPGRVTMRRLNVAEYDNTVQALLGIDFRPSDFVGLPEDSVGNGFDNQGEVLTFSPLLLEKYLDAAEEIASRTIVFDRESLREQKRAGDHLFVEESIKQRYWLAAGRYDITFGTNFGWRDTKHAVPVEVLLDGEVIHREEVDRKWRRIELSAEVDKGEHTITVRFADDPQGHEPSNYERRVFIDTVVVRGPEEGLPAYPPAHANLFVASPGKEVTVRQAARRNFRRLLLKAFRRPATPNEVEQHADLVVATVKRGGTFEEGMSQGLQAALVSPHFLFRVETPDPTKPTPLDGFELANRLSFFLWASMPDGQLLDRARKHELTKPEWLRGETRRMLGSAETRALVDRFFGQWLGLVELERASPDAGAFPQWNGRLREAMHEETLRLVEHVLREDLSLFELFDADYTFVNPRLAELYGVEFRGEDPLELYRDGPGNLDLRKKWLERRPRDRAEAYLYEDEWVRVSAPAGRRGVLTHAGVLTLTSHPRETSPVKRGKWVLDTIVGDPPPPAPPTVPPLEASTADIADRPLRERLARHREDPGCASCHRQMDPIGLAMENFDAVGVWRDKDEHGHAIDASGELNGQTFTGPMELIQLVRAREEDIAKHFARKLLVYAIGRGLEPDDECAIDKIVEDAKANDYRMSSFITGVVMSKPFRFHGMESGAGGPDAADDN